MKTRFAAAFVALAFASQPAFASGGGKLKVAPDAALEILMAGNQRFIAGRPMFPDQSPSRRRELAAGQKPYAIVLTCADSRVAPELYFDQGLGNLFVVRNAGNILNDHTIGSIEYAVEHLGASLIVVVGHAKCGAVAAAVAGGHAPGRIPSIVETIMPAVKASEGEPGDKVDNAIRANARHVAATLAASDPILSEAVKAGRLKVIPARYDLTSGRVEILYAENVPAAAAKPAADPHAQGETVAHAAPEKPAAH